METEARLVIYFYLSAGCFLLLSIIVILAFSHFKKVMSEMSVFVKLMIGLYEQEKQKNEKTDAGGFEA